MRSVTRRRRAARSACQVPRAGSTRPRSSARLGGPRAQGRRRRRCATAPGGAHRRATRYTRIGSLFVLGDALARPACRARLERRADEAAEERRRARRPRLELRVELARDEPRMVGQLDDLDEPALLERPADDEPRLDEPLAVACCSPRSGAGGARGSSPRRTARARASRRPARPPARRAASSRRDPRSPSARAAGRSPGYGVSGSISVEFAPSSPTTCRANSETATCMPRQMPRYGIRRSRATLAGEDLPLPAARAEAARHEHAVDALEQLGRLLVRHVLGVDPAHADARSRARSPACLSASCTERYASWSFTYLPTSAISTSSRRLCDALEQLVPLGEIRLGRARGRASRTTSRSSPSSCSTRGTSYTSGTSGLATTAPGSTSAKSAILSRMSRDSSSCERQTMTSGWIPMRRSSFTECCVGFVFSSPAASMNGTSVTWT